MGGERAMLCLVHFRQAGDVSAQLVAVIAQSVAQKSHKRSFVIIGIILRIILLLPLAFTALLNLFISRHPATPRELFHILNET